MARKRKNGEGSWGTKTIKGKVYRYFRDADGKYFYGNTDKEIKQKISNASQSENLINSNKEQLFGDYVLTWLENMKSGIELTTFNSYVDAINTRLINFSDFDLANVELHVLNDVMLQQYLNALAKRYSLSSIRKTWGLIKKCIRYAETFCNNGVRKYGNAVSIVEFIMYKGLRLSDESFAKFTADKEQRYRQLEEVHLSKWQKLSRLKELSKMYALYAPIQAIYKESKSLKGLAKMKYDKEHKESLAKYPEIRERLQDLLEQGEKITPKQWKAEIQSLQSEYDSISREKSKTATELAYAEIISYNKKNFERELQNESRQHDRQQGKMKRREEEI